MSREERDETGRTGMNPEPGAVGGQTVIRPTPAETQRQTVAGPVTWEEMRSLLRREPMLTERTWRPTVGGLLELLAGAWNFLLGIGAVVGGTIFADLIPTFGGIEGGIDLTTTAAGVFFIVIGLISIIGGALALARRGWPMVLAGSITALIPSPIVLPFLMGILALIFNVLGHKEFWGPREFQKDYESNIEHAREKSERD